MDRHAGVEAVARVRHDRAGAIVRIQRHVGDNHQLILSHGAVAHRDVAPKFVRTRRVHRLDPDSLAIDEADQRGGTAEQVCGQCDHRIEFAFGLAVEQVERVQRRQATGFVIGRLWGKDSIVHGISHGIQGLKMSFPHGAVRATTATE